MIYLAICAFFTLPVLSVIYFIISTVSYSSALKKHKIIPDSVSTEELKSRKRRFTLSFILAAFMVAGTVSVIAMFYVGIAYM
ncbi:MAG: hypothetical protein IIX16_01845 [Clostridia bacterium]|nr:hypothetical protein [Clostridia bacterium]